MPTKIEWAEETWAPVTGCTHVSEGCENCYAARFASGRLKNHPKYKGLAERGKWCGGVRLHPQALEEPEHWRKPRRVFVCHTADLFHEDVPEEFIGEVFSIMAELERHTFLVLTKRPQGALDVLRRAEEVYDATEGPRPWPLPNVWLGVTCENQARADERIPILLRIPAAVRFVSVEPMLGPVDLRLEDCRVPEDHYALNERPFWVICGGESGPDARPMHPDWARSLRDQCVTADVPFFFKQWGEWVPKVPDCGGISDEAYNPLTRPNLATDWLTARGEMISTGKSPPASSALMVRVGKKAAGRLLDGREWNEFPEAVGG